MLDAFNSAGLVQLVKEPSRYHVTEGNLNGNVLYLGLVSDPLAILSCSVGDCFSNFDHFISQNHISLVTL